MRRLIWVSLLLVVFFIFTSKIKAEDRVIGYFTDNAHHYVGNYYGRVLAPLGYIVRLAPRDMFTNPNNYWGFDAVILIGARDPAFYRKEDYDGMKEYVKQGGILIVHGVATWRVDGRKTAKGAIPKLLGAEQCYPSPYWIYTLAGAPDCPLKEFKEGKDKSLPFGKTSFDRKIYCYNLTTGKALINAKVYKAHANYKEHLLIPQYKFGILPAVIVNNFGKGKVITVAIPGIAGLAKKCKIYSDLCQSIFKWALPLNPKKIKIGGKR